jgi:hypothetical protein
MVFPSSSPVGAAVAADGCPGSAHPGLAGFHDAVREWFARSFAAPTQAQERAWPPLLAGASALILAPTGSGKTLAAFLAAIDRLMFAPLPPKEERCRVLYVSPLKALAVDVERNLRVPLAGVAAGARRRATPFHLPEIALRTATRRGASAPASPAARAISSSRRRSPSSFSSPAALARRFAPWRR